MTTQNTTTIVERSVDRIKKSIDIIFARFENIKIMIKCNTSRIDLIHDSTIPRIEKKVKRLEQTIMDHIDPTVGREHETPKSHFIISNKQRAQYKAHLEKQLEDAEELFEGTLGSNIEIPSNNRAYKTMKKIQREAKAIKKMHEYFDNKYNDMELMINDPDDGSWKGR